MTSRDDTAGNNMLLLSSCWASISLEKSERHHTRTGWGTDLESRWMALLGTPIRVPGGIRVPVAESRPVRCGFAANVRCGFAANRSSYCWIGLILGRIKCSCTTTTSSSS
ncbi:hypothetical protein F5Y16DRAFT_397772 [Xylariaceae sp. FL0255]|nr:hypothetical protein F5Y16DRAFT_397772 [Xylariaceae sp. FL0255]